MGSTLVDTGERITCDDTQKVFVHGAYNLGPVLEWRTLAEAMHPGEGLQHTAGASGEDDYILHTAKSAKAYGVSEIDFGQIATCATDYTITTDTAPGIPYHMNPGAYLRNIVFVDPTAAIYPDQCALIDPSTAGAFIPLIEVALVNPTGTGTGEAFNDAAVIGDAAATFAGRCPMRVAYGLADPSDAVDLVTYITTF